MQRRHSEGIPFNVTYTRNDDDDGNVTCSVAPDTVQCSSCQRKIKEGKVLLQWEEEICAECYWTCEDASTQEKFNVGIFGNRCAISNTGDLCYDCVNGNYMLNNVCEVCPDNALLLVGLIFAAVVFAGIAV